MASGCMTRRDKWFWACVGIVLLVGFLALIPFNGEICEKADNAGHKECASHGLPIYVSFKVQAFLDFIGVAITALATIAIAWFTLTLRQSTDRLWKAGDDQLKEIKRSADTSERALTTTERAFVFIDGFNIELTTAADSSAVENAILREPFRDDPGLFITRFAAQPRWKNSGTTPAENLTIRVDWRGPGSPLPVDFTYRADPVPFFLGPQAIEPSDCIEMTGAQALVNWQWNPVIPSPQMFIWGRADYRDVFGKHHFTEWCYQLRLSRPIRSERMSTQFIQWGEYNRTDES
jgi:hypothetical protein